MTRISCTRPAPADARDACAISMPDHPQRPDQHEDVEVEGEDVADLQVAVEHLVAAVPEDRDHRDRRQEVDERHEPAAQLRRRERAVEHAVGRGLEPPDLLLLGAEALHDPDPGEALLDDARDAGELLLQRVVHRRDPLARTAWPRC